MDPFQGTSPRADGEVERLIHPTALTQQAESAVRDLSRPRGGSAALEAAHQALVTLAETSQTSTWGSTFDRL